MVGHSLSIVVLGPLVQVPKHLGNPHAVIGAHVKRNAGRVVVRGSENNNPELLVEALTNILPS